MEYFIEFPGFPPPLQATCRQLNAEMTNVPSSSQAMSFSHLGGHCSSYCNATFET